MGKKKRAQPPSPASASESPFNPALAGLERLRATTPPGDAPTPPSADARPEPDAPAAPAAPGDRWLTNKLVVRHERKGRGGKTVTLLQGLDTEPDATRALARELGGALGCRASCEGDVIVLSGDLRVRLRAWLEQRGARRIVSGSE